MQSEAHAIISRAKSLKMHGFSHKKKSTMSPSLMVGLLGTEEKKEALDGFDAEVGGVNLNNLMDH